MSPDLTGCCWREAKGAGIELVGGGGGGRGGGGSQMEKGRGRGGGWGGGMCIRFDSWKEGCPPTAV